MEKIELKDMTERLIEEYKSQRGDLIRQRVRVIAEEYRNKPKELRNYFDDENLLLAGIATSAYHFITGEIEPIQSTQFGGIGAIILDSSMDLEFELDQLHFAQIFGKSLRGANLKDNAGWSAEAYEYSLWRANLIDNSMTYSKIYDEVGLKATLKDNAMKYSTRTKGTLHRAKIEDDALYGSKIVE